MSKRPALSSDDDSDTWARRVHARHSAQLPEARQQLQQRAEKSRRSEISVRRCSAVRSHVARSSALASEGLRQMAHSESPADFAAIRERWEHAQRASKKREEMSLRILDSAAATSTSQASRAQVEATGTVDLTLPPTTETLATSQAEERDALQEVAAIASAAKDSKAHVSKALLKGDVSKVNELLEQLRDEPKQREECAAKFALYETYASEVQTMRKSLAHFCKETFPTLPLAVKADMKKRLKVVDTREAMSVPNDSASWFVYHMMRQASKNNQAMVVILREFENKLRLLGASCQTECPVCLEPFSPDGKRAAETLSCCHKLCAECWEHWTAARHGRPFCPLCRHDKFMDEVSRLARGRL